MRTSNLLAPLLALASSSAADVLVVDATGSGDHPDLDGALAVAGPGDTILVKPGTYAAPSAPVGKGLNIVADGDGVRIDGGLEIQGLPAGHGVLLSGLELLGTDTYRPALGLISCAGTVRVDECDLIGWSATSPGDDGGAGLDAQFCADVALIRTVARGGNTLDGVSDTPLAGAGLVIGNSVVALYRCLAYGGVGGDSWIYDFGGDGGAGLEHHGGTVYAIHDLFQGGNGGDSFDVIAPSCGEGGPGAYVHPSAELVDQASVFAGGKGGFASGFGTWCYDGAPLAGGKTPLDGVPRALIAPRVVREKEAFQLEVYSLPGEQAWVVWSTRTKIEPEAAREGVWIVPKNVPRTVASLGTVGGSGDLVVPFSFGELGPAEEARLLFGQLVVRDGANLMRVGGPISVLILDDAY